MKILIVVGIFPPDIGGPATFVPLIAKKLVENNYQVEVICLSDSLNHSDNNFEFNVHRIKRRELERIFVHGIIWINNIRVRSRNCCSFDI